MAKSKRVSWSMVIEALKASGGFFYISYDDDDNRVLRCNNGWIQARSPRTALALIVNFID